MYGISEILYAPGAVPEPASFFLLPAGALTILAVRRRRKPAL
ncbi:MAG: PEP-CTERM sorting domain-containing protein [Bryobacterales bacterium]|nr:PEP-CTERM sorting domain-containing protein [Bryobacterales bacterium]